MKLHLAVVVPIAVLALLVSAYSPGRGTAEDNVIMEFGGSPGNIPHVGFVASHPGRLLYLFATGHAPGSNGGGDSNTTLAAVRADGGVLCSVTVPCALQDGVHVPADGGVVECVDAHLGDRELMEFEPLDDNCAVPPTVKVQAAFYWQ